MGEKNSRDDPRETNPNQGRESGDGTDEEVPDSGLIDRVNRPASRRALLTGVAGLSILGLAGSAEADQASTLATTLEYGGSYSGPTSSGGDALRLENTQADGTFTTGLSAANNSNSGAGVFGEANAASGLNFGMFGRTPSPSGRGVTGRATASTGGAIGMLGVTDSKDGTAMQGEARAGSGQAIGLKGFSESISGIGLRGNAVAGSGNTIGVEGRVNSPNGFGLSTPDDARVGGDLIVEGKKNFVQAVDTSSGPREVYYTAVEAGKAHTEVNDTAEVIDGEAVIDLPEHFEMVTSDEEDLTVQLTPHAREKVHPQVVERSTERIVVEDFGDGRVDYTISYTIKGVRKGFENADIVR
jgi:hypothetical protein